MEISSRAFSVIYMVELYHGTAVINAILIELRVTIQTGFGGAEFPDFHWVY